MEWLAQLLAEELPHQYTFDADPTRGLVLSLLYEPLHTWSRKMGFRWQFLVGSFVVSPHFLDKSSS